VIAHSLGVYLGLALASGWFGVRIESVLGLGPKVSWVDAEVTAMLELARKPAREFAAEAEAWARYRKVSGLDAQIAPDVATLARGVRVNGGSYRLAADPRTPLVSGAPFATLFSSARCPALFARGAGHDGHARRAARLLSAGARSREHRSQRARPKRRPKLVALDPLARRQALTPTAMPPAPTPSARDFDPTQLPAEFYANPYPWYDALRETDPVHRCPDGSWFLTRHADLERVYRDRVHFSSDKRVAFAPKYGSDSAALRAPHDEPRVQRRAVSHRVRRQIVGALTPHVLRALEPAVVTLVDRLLDGARRTWGRGCDHGFRRGHSHRGHRQPAGRATRRARTAARLVARDPRRARARAHARAAANGERSVRDFLEHLQRWSPSVGADPAATTTCSRA
jgi:hypothetical protein